MASADDDKIMTSVYVADRSVDELGCLFSCSVDDDDFYMVIAYNLALSSPAYLLRHIQDYEGSRLRGALFGLGFAQGYEDEILAILTTYLGSRDEFSAAEAIDALGRRRDGGPAAQIAQMRSHRSPYVRGAILRYLRSIHGEQSSAALIDALGDEHHIVRQNAIDELVELGDPSAITHIQPLTADPHPDVRMAAESALRDLESRT